MNFFLCNLESKSFILIYNYELYWYYKIFVVYFNVLWKELFREEKWVGGR